jgi:hypothetical protein
MKNNKKKIPTMLEALAKLVNAKKIELQYTECVVAPRLVFVTTHML